MNIKLESINRKINRAKSDILFDYFNFVIMTISLIIVIYPIYFILIASISDPLEVSRGKVFLFPVGINFEGYKTVFEDKSVWIGYKNTILYTVVGVFFNLIVTLTCGYGLSKKHFYGKTFFQFFIVFTLLFDGGMIPRYLIVKQLGIYNTFWAMILPKLAWVYCIMIARTFIVETIPHELYESAQVEGCSYARYFFMVVLPLSPALISILVLYYGTGHWNTFFDAMLYLQKRELYPLQLVLRDIVIKNQLNLSAGSSENIDQMIKKAETVKYSIIVFATLPVLVMYPFMQKYFIKGVMIGAIKG